ncbi:MAG: histidine phosphatase family protein [Sphingomonadales bacterium]|nr:histidine phosphatase family protein [Sphingomonadales bacterium]
MKRLIILRHAKSSWDDPVQRDFDRPLNAKGRRAAEAMGRYMRDRGVSFDRAVASPAARVVETLEAAGRGYGAPIAPQWDSRAYLAPARTLLEILHETPDAAESLLLSGHNSGLEDLVLLLVPESDDDAKRASVEEKFPTCSLAVIEFDASNWSDLEAGQGVLSDFTRPRDLDSELGPDRE